MDLLESQFAANLKTKYPKTLLFRIFHIPEPLLRVVQKVAAAVFLKSWLLSHFT